MRPLPRVLRSDRLLGLIHPCPDCGRPMSSTGEARYEEPVKTWTVVFYCPHDQERIALWAPDVEPTLGEVTRGVDPSTLPRVGEK